MLGDLGLSWTSATSGSLLLATEVPLSVVLAVVFLREAVDRTGRWALVCGFAGTALVALGAGRHDDGVATVGGNVFVVLSVAASAVFLVVTRRLNNDDGLNASTWQTVGGALGAAPFVVLNWWHEGSRLGGASPGSWWLAGGSLVLGRLVARELVRLSGGQPVWRDGGGRLRGTILIGDDVTALRQEEEQTSLYVKAFEATNHAIVVTDVQGTILSINRAFTQLTGYSNEEALGANPRLLQSGRHDPDFYRSMWATLLATGHWHGDMWDRHKDGHLYPKYLAISAITDDAGRITHFVGIFYDNSERKTIEERLDHLAHYDALTGLPNRSLLIDRLEQAIERARRLGLQVALLYLDLDHFKHVNDEFGHDAGDQLLRLAAQRMKTCVRGADTVARLGGDEFVVLLPETHGAEDILTVTHKLLGELSNPYPVNEHLAMCTPSIGISVFPSDGADPNALMKQADTAMYQAKQSGRGTFRFFHDPAL